MDKALFARRRRGVMQLMGEGVAIIPTAPEASRNGDVLYRFRPDSDFQYLTNFSEPEAVAVLIPGREQGEFVLFCREKNVEREMWDGRRTGLEGAMEEYGADDAYPIEDIDQILPGLLENRSKIYCFMGRNAKFDTQMMSWFNEVKTKTRSGINAPAEFVDLKYILHELRLVKRSEELRVMRRAAKISAVAHTRAMQTCKPGMFEYQIEAELEYEFRKGGSAYCAYPSIVAGGENACILHYTENESELNDGDLLLIDAGCELDCYASDITRTFPVNGKFSPEQRDVYEIVLAAQAAAVAATKAGAQWNDPHEAAVNVLAQGLIDLGVLEGSLDSVVESGSYRQYYMHRTGHWLGMDVHDVGDYKIDNTWRELEPGMVLTIEPGLYFAPGPDMDPRFSGIGIRIEDDAVVTADGCELTTSDVVKSVEDIEAVMAG